MTARTSLLLATLLCAAGCSDDMPETSPDASPTAEIDASPDASPPPASVSISLTPSTITAGMSTTLELVLTNHELVDPTATPAPTPKPGEGHYHVFFDDDPNYGAGWESSVELQSQADDPPGVITVRVVLVTSGHVEVAPRAEDEATVTIEAP